MVENRIRVMLAEKKMSAAALSAQMPDMGKVCMSFIVNGIALPTREGMAAMCKTLGCMATDLYDAAELDLDVTGKAYRRQAETTQSTAARAETQQPAESKVSLETFERADRREGRGHEGQERLFFWLAPEEKAALIKAVKGLGYHSTTEWMREMYRQTLKQYTALRLNGKTLHDLIPPIVEPVSPATDKS